MKNKMLAVFLSALLVLTVAVIPAMAENSWSIRDGSFESWGETEEPGAWHIFRKNGTETAELSKDAAYSGEWGVKLTGTDEASRICLYQNVAAIPMGTAVEVTAMIKIVSLTATGGVRLIARYGSMDGTVFDSTNTAFITTTTDWTKYTLSGIISNENELYIDIDVNNASDFEVYVDDVVVQENLFAIRGGDFESAISGISNWQKANLSSADATSEIIVTEEGTTNKALKLTENGWLRYRIDNMPDNTAWLVSLDIKTTEAVGMLNMDWTGGGNYRAQQLNTAGAWVRYGAIVKIHSGSATNGLNIDLRRHAFGTETSAAYFDNLTIKKVSSDELLQNSDFEFGENAYMNWTAAGAGTVGTLTKVSDSFSGSTALKFSGGLAAGNLDIYQKISCDANTVYELSVYAKKDGTASNPASIQLYPEYTGASRKDIKLSSLPADEWVRLSMLFKPTQAVDVLAKIRLIGNVAGSTSTIIFDKASVRAVSATEIHLAEANSAHASGLKNNGKVTVNTPISSENGKTMILAVYSTEGTAIKLADVQVVNTSDADVQNGFASLTLQTAVIADFAEKEYYAKLILLDKAGTVKPLEKAILITK